MNAAVSDESRETLYDQLDRSIGGALAEKLVADFGGRRIYVPEAPSPHDSIARSIGLMAAIEMAHSFGGLRLLIPVSSNPNRRRARILAMRSENVSVSRIARELRCSERYVYKVLALNREFEPSVAAIKQTPAPFAERLKRGAISGR